MAIIKLKFGQASLDAGDYTARLTCYDAVNINGLTYGEFPLTVKGV